MSPLGVFVVELHIQPPELMMGGDPPFPTTYKAVSGFKTIKGRPVSVCVYMVGLANKAEGQSRRCMHGGLQGSS